MGFQSGTSNRTSVDLKSSDIDKISKQIIASLSPLLGSGKTVYIQGKPGETVNEDYTPETLEKLAKSMILQQSEKSTNFTSLGTSKEVKKDKQDINRTLDLLKDLE